MHLKMRKHPPSNVKSRGDKAMPYLLIRQVFLNKLTNFQPPLDYYIITTL